MSSLCYKYIPLSYKDGPEREIYYAYDEDTSTADRVIHELKKGEIFSAVDLILMMNVCPPKKDLDENQKQKRVRVLDVGAHIGTYSLALGVCDDDYEVIAIEAAPQNASLYKKSLEKNGFENIKLINAAVSNKEELINFLDNGTAGAMVMTDSSETEDVIQLNTRTIEDILDECGWDSVDFVKIDVEGYEIKALEGMKKYLLADNSPIVFFEVNAHSLRLNSETPNTLLEFLEECGYMCFVPEAGFQGNDAGYHTSELKTEGKNFARNAVTLVPISCYEPIPVCVEDLVALKSNHVANLSSQNIPVVTPYPRSIRVGKLAFNISAAQPECARHFIDFMYSYPTFFKENLLKDAFEALINKPHIVDDNLKDELRELVSKFSTSKSSPLPPIPFRF